MPQKFVDGLPGLADSAGWLSLRVRGRAAFLRSQHFIGRFSLESGKVEWLIERSEVRMSEANLCLPRRILRSGSDLWTSETDEFTAELLTAEDGGLVVSMRHGESGRHLWDHYIPIPEAADWAEPAPAWPGAQTEEIDAFIADDPRRFIVCLSRQSRRSMMYSSEITVATLPPYACQTDAIRFDPSTGRPIWQAAFRDVAVGIVERKTFTGIWSKSPRVGVVDFEKGTNTILREYPYSLGWPVRDGAAIALPWHSAREVGIAWIDQRGNQVRAGTWLQPRVTHTLLHPTEAGLAMQTNDQTLWWIGKEKLPSWNIRAKPYIYRVHCCPGTNVFVGTAGRGGRLLAFDAASGRETLNLKPARGGAGTLTKVPAHDVLVAKFWTSKRNPIAGTLFVIAMKDRRHRLEYECWDLLGTWQHGAVCLAGTHGERLAVVDLR